uniref:Uncharacterized protein n=1 Tax=viral metagenome TaxID=1070528 RepID=A0A6C0BP40_9ZZZZ
MVPRDEHDAELAQAHAAAAQFQAETTTLQARLKDAEETQKQARAQIADGEATIERLTKELESKQADYADMMRASVHYDNKKKLEIKKLHQQLSNAEDIHARNQAILEAKEAAAQDMRAKLDILGVTPDMDVKLLQQRQNKRKRYALSLANAYDAALDLEADIMQQDDSSSMPTRYLALRNANAASNGGDNKLIKQLNKDTFYAMGENLSQYVRIHGMSRRQLLRVIGRIIDDEPEDIPGCTIKNNIGIFGLICGNVKRVLGLPYATHASLGHVYQYCADYNHWVKRRELPERYRLIQQFDLARKLGINGSEIPRLPRFARSDIRQYFQIP